MNPHIARLDRSLAKNGEWITLRRVVGTTNSINIDVKCRAFVRAFRPEELIGTISQTDSQVILSPTQIDEAQWPGGQPVSSSAFVPDPRIPKINDKCLIQGRVRNITFSKPILVDGELARIELTVAG